MSNHVTGKRNKISIFIRKWAYFLIVDVWIKRYRLKRGRRNTDEKKIMFYPAIKDKAVLADVYNRASWYLPQSEYSTFEVFIFVSKELADTSPDELETPLHQERYMDKSNTHIKLISSDLKTLAESATKTLIWDIKGLWNRDIVRNRNTITIADRHFYSNTESINIANVHYYTTLTDGVKNSLKEQSRQNYIRFLSEYGSHENSYLFATGPSIEKAFDHDCKDGVRIVCNSIVKNKGLLDYIKPNALFFADSTFFGSPSLYSAQFRKLMIEAVNKYDCYLFVQDVLLSLYMAHFPHLKNRLIGFEADELKAFRFPKEDDLKVGNVFSNILIMMVQFASAISKNIFIIGADGREPNENYFWKHNVTAQLTDLMESVYYTHPSFFRDRVYVDYYNDHCENMENLIEYGEKLGKNYYSLTKSHIPALKDRFYNQ